MIPGFFTTRRLAWRHMSESPQLNISIDLDQIKSLVSEAVLAQLDSEKPTNIIRQAIDALQVRPKARYGYN